MILANVFGSDGIIFVVIALVVVFGGSQLPKIARNVGSAGREFRKAQQEAEEEEKAREAAKAIQPAPLPPVVPPAPVAAAPVTAAPVTAAPVTAAPVTAADQVTLNRTDLEALLDERLGKGGSTN